MNVYMPPQRRDANPERRAMHRHVRTKLESSGVEIISRTGGNRSLPWLKRAGALVLETNVITRADETECLYFANELGKQVLVLYDFQHGKPGSGPSEQLVAEARRDKNENANIWIVKHGQTGSGIPRLNNVDIALSLFSEFYLGGEPAVPYDVELPLEFDRSAF